MELSIKGLSDGKHEVEITSEVSKIPSMFPEFFGSIAVTGFVQKIGKRYIVTGQAECNARLVCDRSGEEFEERIIAPLQLNYVANTHLYLEQQDREEPEQPYYIREDANKIFIGDEVRQELAVNLPLKRIAPAYRDKSLDDLYPGFDADAPQVAKDEPDDRWAALKNISFS